MVSKENIIIIDKDKVPPGRLVGTYTFLRDMGKTLEKDKAIQLTAKDAAEAKKVQNRWRAYYKGVAHSRKEELPSGKITVYLWKES
ncbi:unnamed protein product [marine sediment metagenome]|uniref:Uncharacterized protein n=1 Tax=marine sediment metagenome TaxID=412755 RepID=X1HIZ6_9ZZZZ